MPLRHKDLEVDIACITEPGCDRVSQGGVGRSRSPSPKMPLRHKDLEVDITLRQ